MSVIKGNLKKIWLNRTGVVLAIVCSYLIVYGILGGTKIPGADSLPVSSESSVPIIILDAGHGGIDSGCVSVTGFEEKHINLDIMLSVRDMMTALGYKVEVTRDTDISIHDKGIKGLSNQKKNDMEKRLALFNKYSNAVCISIHQNQFTQPQYSGAQMFYSDNNPNSGVLAQIMQDSFVANLQPDNKREIKSTGNDIYLCAFSKNPTVMVECGFLSNPDEAALLETEEYRSKVAFTIVSGLCRYIEEYCSSAI